MEYLKACRDIRSMSHRAKLVALETFSVQKAANAKCFNFRKAGHMKKQSRMPVQTAKNNTAKSLQSCPTLCDPIDGSPPGSPIPGILQARTLEWVAISFSNA